ncbi:hypothetical protein P43SY_005065 [Pythium insidiosum]|uniref:Uncharacterized protein n=1 Tax=Pythium insidiosum TaxID=114742 RepID=A0AAD5LLU5_PYTIN|nr:hypothetical protein P43SY_005065 [Pythium insidiosum]
MAMRCALKTSPTVVSTATRWMAYSSSGLARRPQIARSFSVDSTRRPKAIKVKKGEARRRVEPKPKAANDALVEQQPPSAPAEYPQGGPFQDSYPQTLGGRMKETVTPGHFEGSGVIPAEKTEE